MNTIVTTVQQLQALQSTTYIYATIVLLVAFLLSVLFANLVAWQGGHDRSYILRRIAWVVIGVLSGAGYWIYCQTVVMDNIRNQGFKSLYGTTTNYALALILLGYILLGVGLMLAFRKSKFGSILGATKS